MIIPRSLTLRHAIVLVVVVGLLLPSLLISGLSWHTRYQANIKKLAQELLQQDAAVLAIGMQEPLWTLDHESAEMLVNAMVARNDDIIRIEVRDRAQGVLTRSERLDRRVGYTVGTTVPVLYRSMPIGWVDIEVGSVRLHGLLRDEFVKSVVELTTQAMLSIVLILLLLEHRLVRPLHKLSIGVARLSNYQLDKPFTWHRLDEIGLLSRRLEDTRISLQALFKELDWKNRELEQDIKERKQMEMQKTEVDRVLLRLAQGTKDFAGESFLELLIADLANALHADYAVIGLRAGERSQNGEENEKVRALVAWKQGQILKDFEYFSAGTPCGLTLHGEMCVVTDQVTKRFPNDRVLVENNWRSYAGAPLRDANGNIIGIISILDTKPIQNPELVRSLLQVFSERVSADLERKNAEEKLRNSEQRFAQIFELSPIAMFVTRLRGAVRNVNLAFEQHFLRPREDVIGKDTAELNLYCDLHDRAALLDELELTGSTNSSSRDVWMFRGNGERILVQFYGHTFQQGGETHVILACSDITDKYRIENEIRELNATLEQRVVARTEELQRANQDLATTLETLRVTQEELSRSEKLAALGALVAGIAHELNTPIGNSLIVASTLAEQTKHLTGSYADNGLKRSMLEKYMNDADQASEIMVRNLQRAADLVNSFKQVAVDQTSSQRRRFLLTEVVSENLLTLWPTLKKTTFTVTQDIPSDLTMDSFPGPLGQVLTNLVNNALVHAFDGRQDGTVSISARHTTEGWIELNVTDNGLGIPPANLNRIFDPFFTTRLGSGGTGLGLNIVHNIVTNLLGGRIRVHSLVGHGTTFTVALPLTAPQRQNEEAFLKNQNRLSLV